MKRYRIRYRDTDPGCPVFSCTVRAYDREHAEMLFWDMGDPEDTDWTILSIAPAPEVRRA